MGSSGVNSKEIFLENVVDLLGNRSNYWLAQHSGLSQATISRIMSEKMTPALESVDAIAKALGVDPWIMLMPKTARKSKIPPYLQKALEDQPDLVYQTVWAMLGPLANAKGGKAKK